MEDQTLSFAAMDADAVRSPRPTHVLLRRWTRALHDTQRLRPGDARPDGFASLQWRRATPSERWLRLRIPTTSDHASAVEFLLLAQRLLAADAAECEDQVLEWLDDPQARRAPAVRLRKCCMGGCRLPGADPDPSPLSAVVPCARHVSWRRTDTPPQEGLVAVKKKPQRTETAWTLGVVVDFEDEYDAAFLALLHRACNDPLAQDIGLSEEFKAAYLELGLLYPTFASPTVRLHIRLSSPKPSGESMRDLSMALCKWQIVKRQSFSINGVDVAAPSLLDFLSAAPALPFHKLLVCASSSLASRMDPLAAPAQPLHDAALRLLLTKSQNHLLELEVCNVRITNFDCILQPFAAGTCHLQVLRLREFAMGVVSNGGIFAALKDANHPIAHTLEELEIDQALHSAGGLSFWLEREAGEMLLKNDRLVKCYIRQACSMYPSTTHKGFRETRGREIHVPVPLASKLAFLASKPIKLPRDVTERILELAGRSATRDAQMHYRFIQPDQLYQFTRDLEAWKPQRSVSYEYLPYGSYYH